MKSALAITACILLLLSGCSAGLGGRTATGTPADASGETDMTVTSSGIINGFIEPKYGMYGDKKQDGIPVLSIPLTIENVPQGAISFAILMEDPDAGNFVHWMAVNVKEREIPEDFSENAGDKAVKGTNDFGKTGYGGPMPPNRDHTYQITVYALDSTLELKEGFTKKEFDTALKGHVLATASIKGIYKK